MRPTVDFDSPERLAIEVRDQCVASFGADSAVDSGADFGVDFGVDSEAATTICSSVIFLGAPGRSSSTSPPKRRWMNRERHLPTVGRDTPNDAATSTLDMPSAHASTIRLRNAND